MLSAGIVLSLTWFVAFCTSLWSFFVTTDSFRKITETSVYNPESVPFQILVMSLLIGGLFYLSGTTVLSLFLTLSSKAKSKLHFIHRYAWVLLVFPFYMLGQLKPHWKAEKKKDRVAPIIASVVVSLTYLPIWLALYMSVLAGVGYTAGNTMGIMPVYQNISGTGSMYPTFPKGTAATDKERSNEVVATVKLNRYPGGFMLFGHRLFGHTFERGDIITFENAATDKITKEEYGQASGYMKRIVALPGDTLELRDGIVYLNSKPLKEPYIESPRSTFAETFLSECKQIQVPAHKLFVMGDNRKGSGDSREIGYVDFKDVTAVLPLKDQEGKWDTYWRDTSHDFDESSKIKLNKQEYVDMLNKKRKEAGVPELTYNDQLEQSAVKRGEVMLKFDDLSLEASKSGYTMERAMDDVGYFNGLYGESPTVGYYKAEELIDNQFAFASSKKFLLEKDFDEVGIAEVEGEINGCPAQILVQHYAGYVPPNYSQAGIKSWEDALTNLHDIQPSWADLRNSGDFYDQHRAEVDRINSLIDQRIGIVSGILTKLHNNQWLNKHDQQLSDQDTALAKEIETLSSKLNSL